MVSLSLIFYPGVGLSIFCYLLIGLAYFNSFMIIRAKLASLKIVRYPFSQTKQTVAEGALSQKIQKNGIFLSPILAHVESSSFRAKFQLKKYLHAHAWCCLHAWLLDYRSQALLNSLRQLPSSLFMRRQLASELAAFNYNQVQKFSDRKDREVYYQLKRMNNVVHFALDEHFLYKMEEKPLSQVICEDMGLYPSGQLSENEEENLKKIEQYITLKMTQLRQTPLSLIRNGSFKWNL